MAYMYDKLKEALGGAKFSNASNGRVIQDWSPNSVKALVICKDFIFVAYHVKPPKIYWLTANEVAMDLQKNGSQGALHNLLSQRQLSCMEEFYVDGLFQNYRGALDLEGYIGKLLNEKSRLRYWGYIANGSALDLENRFGRAVLNSDPSYAYALDKERESVIQFKTVGSEWHKNYNLRPQFYKLDADGGQLYRWFVSCEKKLEEYVEAEKSRLEGAGKDDALFQLLNVDYGRVEDIRLFMELYKYLTLVNSKDKLLSNVVEAIRDSLKKQVVNGKTKEISALGIRKCLKDRGVKPEGDIMYLISLYNKYGLTFTGESNVEATLEDLVDLVKSGDGLFRFEELLDRVLNRCLDNFNVSYPNGAMMLKMFVMQVDDEIPNGNLRKRLGGKEIEGGSYKGYIKLLLMLCGWNEQSFRDYLAANYPNGIK